MLPPLRRFELSEFLLSLPDMPEFLLSELRSGKEASTGGLSGVRRPLLMLASDSVAEVRDMLLLEDATLGITPSSRSSLEARGAEPHLLKPSPLLLLLLPWRGCTYCTSLPTFG